MADYDHDAVTARRVAAAVREHPGQLAAWYAELLRLPPSVVAAALRTGAA